MLNLYKCAELVQNWLNLYRCTEALTPCLGNVLGTKKWSLPSETETVVQFNGPDVTDILNLYKSERELVHVQHTTLDYREPWIIEPCEHWSSGPEYNVIF